MNMYFPSSPSGCKLPCKRCPYFFRILDLLKLSVLFQILIKYSDKNFQRYSLQLFLTVAKCVAIGITVQQVNKAESVQ